MDQWKGQPGVPEENEHPTWEGQTRRRQSTRERKRRRESPRKGTNQLKAFPGRPRHQKPEKREKIEDLRALAPRPLMQPPDTDRRTAPMRERLGCLYRTTNHYTRKARANAHRTGATTKTAPVNVEKIQTGTQARTMARRQILRTVIQDKQRGQEARGSSKMDLRSS